MNRQELSHPSIDALSALLDGELSLAERAQVKEHLSACSACSARLDGLRRTTQALARVRRATPPPALAARTLETAARTRTEPLESMAERLGGFVLSRFLSGRLVLAGLALLVSNASWFAVREVQLGGRDAALRLEPPREIVSVLPGTVRFSVPTTSEVAGREFVLLDAGWVERGLERAQPSLHVHAESPVGRRLLARYDGLGDLMTDGSRIVLRYRGASVELVAG
jgi:anti-sigma factor RsiW